jgi:hypothetical protein
MSREVHVRFWEGVGVQLPHATRLPYRSFIKVRMLGPLHRYSNSRIL